MSRKRPLIPVLVLGASAAALLYAAAPGRTQANRKHPAGMSKAAQAVFARDVAPIVGQYCVGCHGGNRPAAGINLTAFRDAASVLKARGTWERVARNVRDSQMPPTGAPHPSPVQREQFVHWIEAALSQADCDIRDPGRVTMRRLNRLEYNNTIRDLFGVDLRPADSFPSDDVGYGFDNIGDVLSLSPLLMEKYIAAAEQVSQAVIATPEGSAKPLRFPAERLQATSGGPYGGGGLSLSSNGEVATNCAFPADGEYLLRARAFGQQAGPEPARMALRLDGREVARFDVKAEEGAPEVYQVRLKVPAGKRRFAAAYLNDYYEPQAADPKLRGDRNLIVDYLEMQGPLGMPNPLPAAHRRILGCPPGHHATPAGREACARKSLSALARRAWRRPVTKQELDRLVRIVQLAGKEGESYERGIQLGVQAILVSPNFLYRVETAPASVAKTSQRSLNSYEMASRLSYFLWSSMPDDTLVALAAKDALRDPKTLAAQARRMLRDPKARALTDGFAAQWLQLRNLDTAAPDPGRFPAFDNDLRTAMRRETELFFEGVEREDRSVLEFLDADYTYLNERLARHYGIPGVQGESFRRFALTNGRRGGLVTQASILTVTSNPTRTSPVKRGKWILEQLFGTPPPPPPPGLPPLQDDRGGPLIGTLRQRMEQHRSNSACASCHARMDPLGFGLENYDAVGAWREQDGGLPVDSTGSLPDGKTFRGPTGLKSVLKAKKGSFVRTLSEKMLTYALGRGLESADRCHVDAVTRQVTGGGYRFSSLVTAVVVSKPFRMKREGER